MQIPVLAWVWCSLAMAYLIYAFYCGAPVTSVAFFSSRLGVPPAPSPPATSRTEGKHHTLARTEHGQAMRLLVAMPDVCACGGHIAMPHCQWRVEGLGLRFRDRNN